MHEEHLRDRNALIEQTAFRHVKPEGLNLYAEREGWVKTRPYGDLCDVYEKEGIGSIVLPRTCGEEEEGESDDSFSDYMMMVNRLIKYWARFKRGEELVVYCEIMKLQGCQAGLEVINDRLDQWKKVLVDHDF